MTKSESSALKMKVVAECIKALDKYPSVVQSMYSTILCHELRAHHNALELQKAFVENSSDTIKCFEFLIKYYSVIKYISFKKQDTYSR